MRVLMLSWEYPPVVVGGLGRHVHALATALAATGHEVTVISRHEAGSMYDEILDGVRIVRVAEDPPVVPFADLLAWTMALNHAVTRTALRVAGDADFDVVHAHDWLVAHAAATLKEHLTAPLVATVHATEAGRHQGWLPGPVNRAIHSVEWWLTYEARRVITCSSHMRWEVTRLFDLPPEKVDVVPNGIDLQAWSAGAERSGRVRHQLGLGATDPLVLFAGRLEWEKGVHTLLEAMPRLRRRHPDLHLAIAGSGTQDDRLRELARRLRVSRSVRFLGHLPTEELAAVAAAADVACVPSLYEPFGLVALEAAAAGTPLVVSDTGGLREFVDHGRTGLRVPPEDPAALADAISALLRDQVLARRLVRAARAAVAADYSWPAIAGRTARTYQQATQQERALRASLGSQARAPLSVVVRDGNLLGQ
ncbi:MAG: glycosyltransferase family 4 protein [Mycobacteriales bacterium]